jgi:hypothetical protein
LERGLQRVASNYYNLYKSDRTHENALKLMKAVDMLYQTTQCGLETAYGYYRVQKEAKIHDLLDDPDTYSTNQMEYILTKQLQFTQKYFELGENWRKTLKSENRDIYNYLFDIPVVSDPRGDDGDVNWNFIVPVKHHKTVPYGWTPIYTAQDLNNIRNNPEGKYILMNDIDLKGWGNWVPIGDMDNPFHGQFSGNGYTIYNLSITSSTNSNAYGLFGYAQALIKDLSLQNINISILNKSPMTAPNLYVGSIAGVASSITNCFTSSGYIEVDCQFDLPDCLQVGGISSTVDSGEYNYNDVDIVVNSNSHIEILYVSGVHRAPSSYRCFNTGNIRIYANDYRAAYVAGISAANTGVDHCTNLGNLSFLSSGDDDTYLNALSTSSVQNSYNVGDLSLINSLKCIALGSFLDYSRPITSYNYGRMYAIFKFGNETLFGGTSVYYPYSFANEESFALVGAGKYYNQGGIDLSAAQFQQKESFVSFDFDTIWDINPDINKGRPFLRNLIPAWRESTVQPIDRFVEIDRANAEQDKASLSWNAIRGNNASANAVTTNLSLPTNGTNGSTITWSSSNTAVIFNNGVVTRPAAGTGSATITLTAAIKNGAATETYTITITVVEQIATVFTLNVVSGTGSGSYAAGTTVNITANTAPSGKVFDRWTTTAGTITNATSASTIFTMPASAATVTANYKDAPGTTYALTVTSGTGSGNYAAGAVVTITANAAPSGKVFDRWTAPTGTIANATSATTTFTMPASTATVTANYKDAPVTTYALTVQNGTGSGNYAAGTIVNITANTAPSGKVFDRWTTAAGTIANATSATTTFTMPASTATVTATYKVDSTPADKSALNNRINELATIQKGGYTDDSWNAFQSALSNARMVANNPAATQQQVNDALNALNNAHNALKEKNFIKLWGKKTEYESTGLNWFLCIVFFGWIWMAF